MEDGTATARKTDFRRWWKRYGGTLLVFICTLAILAFYAYVPPRTATSITNFLRPYRGGQDPNLLIAYVGVVLVVGAQFYTIVKRIGVPQYIRKLGGSGRWLTAHIGLSLGGLIGILIHSGFPFTFPYRNLELFGYATMATWLLILTTISGVFGRYLYKHLPAMKKAFSVWRPAHVVETALFFGFTFLHIWTVAGRGG
jgi:hypothetical protein